MRETPLISVVMSSLNPREDEIKRAVQSIIDQSLGSWELLIYDDGSYPEKSKLIRTICESDNRIFYIRGNTNQGIAAGLNECIKRSKGKYIARMDDDDISLPQRFEIQADFLAKNTDYQWVGVLADLFDNSGIWGRADRPERPVAKDFFHSSPFIHPSVMFRRELLVNVDGYCVSKRTARCEDYELFMRLYALGYKGYNIQKVLFLYQEESKVLKRSWKYCYYEALVRWEGFKNLNILSIKTLHHVFKPLAVRTLAIFPGLAQKIRVKRNKGDHIVGAKTD